MAETEDEEKTGSLSAAGLSLNKDKCIFGVSSVSFLGHLVTASGISPLPKQVETITSMLQPTTKVELQRYLGCINFYHRFVPHLASVLAPLHALCSSVKTASATLTWTPALISTFEASKSALADTVRLVHPDPDSSTALSLTTDASTSL